MNNDTIQKTRLCLQTYINLYGTVPGIRVMVDWTGLTYEEVLLIYKTEIMPKASTPAA